MHSVVFGGFAAAELATRIDDAKPTMIVSASCGIEPSRLVEYKPLLDEAIEAARSAVRRRTTDDRRLFLARLRLREWVPLDLAVDLQLTP